MSSHIIVSEGRVNGLAFVLLDVKNGLPVSEK